MYLAALLIFAAAAWSQTNNSSVDSYAYDLCNTSISNANASGIVTFNPRWPIGTADPSWAITITGGNGKELKRQFWYDTAGENYADDLALKTDVCAFAEFYLPLNAHRLGQHDPGNCSSVFTKRCIEGVTSMASISASKWTRYSSPPPYENLTAGVLPTICDYIANDLKKTVKDKCGPQLLPDGLRDTNFASTRALTGYNYSSLYYSNCSLSAGDKTFHPAGFSYPIFSPDDWRSGSDVGYDNLTNTITPILTVFMPVANMERTEWSDQARSVLQCIRASNVSEGSRVAPALAEGTAWPKPGALSVGGKGGVAAGVVVFVLTVGGLLLYLWLAKRKKRARASAAAAQADPTRSDDDKKLPPEADGAFGVHELTPDDRKPEIDSNDVSELGGGGSKPSELANTSAPVELPGENAGGGR